MNFEGLIFTDAMDMAAIDALFSREEAAARAVEAGADILLMSPDPARAVRGVMEAVLSGRIPEARIDASVRRILEAKAELGLHEERRVSPEGVHRRIGIPANVAVAQEVANRSLTLLRNERNLLPLAGTPSAKVLSVTYRRANDLLGGRTFDARLRQTYTGLQTATIGADSPREVYQRLTDLAGSSDLVVISLHITAVSYSGTVAAPPELIAFINAVSESGRPHVVVSFGNPYLLTDVPRVQSHLLAWDGAEVSPRAAARALHGEIGLQGRTPIRIPPNFEIGSGIPLDARIPGGASTSNEGGCG
jgi:beta-N-acetylhexosaminidase